jgi:rubredoxin
MIYTCSVCGFQYDEKAEKTPFSELPDDWHCPICNAPKSAFEKSS